MTEQYLQAGRIMLNGSHFHMLTELDKARGYVRPLRYIYTHLGCGAQQHMSLKVAEAYAREPTRQQRLYCLHCDEHFNVGAKGEFVWAGTEERVGT